MACKIILDYDNIFESMESLKLLTVYERIFLRKAKSMYMYKVSHSLTPVYINDLFDQRNQSENVPVLRSSNSNNFIPPKPNERNF